jgi:hypothetical protein
VPTKLTLLPVTSNIEPVISLSTIDTVARLSFQATANISLNTVLLSTSVYNILTDASLAIAINVPISFDTKLTVDTVALALDKLTVEGNTVANHMFNTSNDSTFKITNTDINNSNIVTENMFNVKGEVTVATVSIADNEITGSMFDVTGNSVSFVGTNNIKDNEVGKDLIKSVVEASIAGQFIVDNNTIEENLIHTTKEISINAKLSITENTVNTGHLLYTDENISIANAKNERVDIMNNNAGGYLVYAKDIITNSMLNITNNTSGDTLIEVENIKAEKEVTIDQNTAGKNLLNVKEDLQVAKEMTVNNNIVSRSVVRVANNVSMPTTELQIFNNEYGTDKDDAVLYVEGDVFEVKQLEITDNESNTATKVAVLENANLVSTGKYIKVNNNSIVRAESNVQNIITLNNGSGIELKNGAYIE